MVNTTSFGVDSDEGDGDGGRDIPSILIVDNVVRGGSVADPSQTDLSVEGVRNLLEALKEDRETDATNIATVGEKGYDGFICAVKLWIRQFDHKYTCIVYQLLL
ncbi:hypothetical protein PAXINDRAFT_154458 [Paxillus involutus ATCC 200175]|nr:hypothetical protein PAXINDRAFT_154458 [Paxillus involutus ATCC 200175]